MQEYVYRDKVYHILHILENGNIVLVNPNDAGEQLIVHPENSGEITPLNPSDFFQKDDD